MVAINTFKRIKLKLYCGTYWAQWKIDMLFLLVGTKVCVRTDNKKWNHNFKCVHIIKKI